MMLWGHRIPMVINLYTSDLSLEKPENLSQKITSAIVELQKAFPEQKIEALSSWDKYYIAIPLSVHVDLPTRGPVNDVDIREQEPIFMLLHRQNYPYKAPFIYSNRRDFPKGKLPHLNPRHPGSPASFCLHRGRLDDWFAEHTIVDLVKRVQNWLRDAAGDRLIRLDDGFEPTRLDDVTGYVIYDPSDIRNHIYQNNGNAGFEFILYKLLKNSSRDPLVSKNNHYAIQLEFLIHIENRPEVLKLCRKINELYTEENKFERMLVGILAWPAKEYVDNRYFAELPKNLKEFQDWSEGFGIPLKDALKTYLSEDLQLLSGIPVTLIIPRPQNLIGTESRLELLNFLIIAGGDHWPKDGDWDLDANIRSLGHRTPLTLQRAREISSQKIDLDFGRLLFLGCGVVGSKLILHLARSGQANMTLVDYDELSPHNLVRNGLLHESLGMNKAEAIKDAIDGIFYADYLKKIEVLKESALNLFLGEKKDILIQHNWLIDTTASSMTLNLLSQVDLPETLSCCRCEIADKGRLGFLSVEGFNRNPRLDDLQALLFDMAIENPAISHWLQSNKEQRKSTGSIFEEINIGISCSSETMRLSDEVASLHAALFAMGYRKIAKEQTNNSLGRIQISQHSEEESLKTVVKQFDVLPITVLRARNNHNWQVRLGYDSKMKLEKLFKQASPNETGGLLIGMVNHNRKIIYVTRVLPAPPDSKSYPYAFVRGIKDIPNYVYDIENLTGDMLGYVGEWHTHPAGGPDLSRQDMDSVKKIKNVLDETPIPTHVMVVTKTGQYPYIFTPR